MTRRILTGALVTAFLQGLAGLPGSAHDELLVVRNTRLRVGPSSLTLRIRTLHPPETATRLRANHSNNYVEVRTERGETGWVYRHHLAEVDHDHAGAIETIEATRAFSELPPIGPEEMRVHFINVGQGDSTLLEFPCGVALIDTGGERSPEGDDPDFDSVPVLRAYLDAFFASRPDLDEVFDLVALTHPHIDHTRGIEMVSSTYFLTNVIDNGQRRDDIGGRPQIDLQNWLRENEEFLSYRGIAERDIVSDTGLTGPVIDPIGACGESEIDPTIRVLWGRLQSGDSGHGKTNNHSVVVRVDLGEFSTLFTGDLESPGINGLVRKFASNPDILDVDVYQVGHHGSHNATRDNLVEAMSPKLAVVSMGPFDRTRGRFLARQFGHPNHEAVELLEAGLGCTRTPVQQQVGLRGAFRRTPSEWEERTIEAGLFATGWDGNVVVTADADGTFDVWTERSGLDTGMICGGS